MTSAGTKATAVLAPPHTDGETPWWELINDAPEPPEDAMQQATTILYVMSTLLARYEGDPTTLVSEQTNVIYDSAVPGSVVVPDGYVVFGVDAETAESRRSYRIDEWGAPPAFVLEVGSPSTAHRDLDVKRELYARMGVEEYWRLDKYGESYPEPMVGERLVDSEYVRLELHVEPDGDVWSHSEVLGVDIYHRVEDGIGRFVLRDGATGEWLNNMDDARRVAADARAAAAEGRAAESDARAAAAERWAATADARAAESDARAAAAEAELERRRRQLGQP